MSKTLYISLSTYRRLRDTCGFSDMGLPYEKVYNSDITKRIICIETNKTLNSTLDNYIKNSISGKFWVHNTNQELKVGKIISILWPYLDSTEIENKVNIWKQQYVVDTSEVKVSADIEGVYDISTCGGSCMAYKGRFMSIYEDAGCNIAYICDDYGNLKARALLWYDLTDEEGAAIPHKFIDRIFYEQESYKLTLKKWASDNNYKDLTAYEDFLVSKEVGHYYEDGVPYIDTMKHLTTNYRLCNANDIRGCIDTFESTRGCTELDSGISGIDKGIYCEDDGEYHDEEDCYYCETDGHFYYCNDDLVYIEDAGWYCDDDADICYTEDNDYQLSDECIYIEDTGDWYHTEPNDVAICFNNGLYYSLYYLVYCYDIEDYVNKTVSTYLVTDLDEYYYYDTDLYYDEDEELYFSSEEAYKEYKGITDENED